MIDQPTAEQALKELEVLVGTWDVEATPPGGEPWPGGASITYDWLDNDKRLIPELTLADVEDKPETKSTAWQQIGVTYFSQLNNHSEIFGEARVKLADGGIGGTGVSCPVGVGVAAAADASTNQLLAGQGV